MELEETSAPLLVVDTGESAKRKSYEHMGRSCKVKGYSCSHPVYHSHAAKENNYCIGCSMGRIDRGADLSLLEGRTPQLIRAAQQRDLLLREAEAPALKYLSRGCPRWGAGWVSSAHALDPLSSSPCPRPSVDSIPA